MADRCGDEPDQLEAAEHTAETNEALQRALVEARLDGLVGAANPLDVTPMADDGVHERCARALLSDPNVDVAVLGAVPFTANMHTLPDADDPGAGWDAPEGYAGRITALCQQQPDSSRK